MWRRSFLLLPFVLALSCGRPQSLANVPIGPGGQCKISVGDVRAHVRLRCAGPCASAVVAEGVCAGGEQGACENSCDVYQDVEVCYVNDRVVSLDRLDRVTGRQQWCFWPDTAPQRRRR